MYEGFHMILAVNPVGGGITGFGFGAASAKDQPLADTFFALCRSPPPQWQGAGAPAQGPYVVEKGFEGAGYQTAWRQDDDATVICPPKHNSRRLWPKSLRRGWAADGRDGVRYALPHLPFGPGTTP
jgi:hypothetical protein